MNAPPQAVPRPPAHIWDEMVEAGAAGDTVRLGIAHAMYAAWLRDNGYPDGTHGSTRPDEAIR